eukprot:357325-Chlamydomonas_euryale.AAC.4
MPGHLHACQSTCMHAGAPACMPERLHACMHARAPACMPEHLHACQSACMHARAPACMPERLHACMHQRVHAPPCICEKVGLRSPQDAWQAHRAKLLAARQAIPHALPPPAPRDAQPDAAPWQLPPPHSHDTIPAANANGEAAGAAASALPPEMHQFRFVAGVRSDVANGGSASPGSAPQKPTSDPPMAASAPQGPASDTEEAASASQGAASGLATSASDPRRAALNPQKRASGAQAATSDAPKGAAVAHARTELASGAAVAAGGFAAAGPPWLPPGHPLSHIERGLREGATCEVRCTGRQGFHRPPPAATPHPSPCNPSRYTHTGKRHTGQQDSHTPPPAGKPPGCPRQVLHPPVCPAPAVFCCRPPCARPAQRLAHQSPDRCCGSTAAMSRPPIHRRHVTAPNPPPPCHGPQSTAAMSRPPIHRRRVTAPNPPPPCHGPQSTAAMSRPPIHRRH